MHSGNLTEERENTLYYMYVCENYSYNLYFRSVRRIKKVFNSNQRVDRKIVIWLIFRFGNCNYFGLRS